MRLIAPGLYAFTGLIMGRSYLIEDADGLTVIDASLPGAGQKMARQIEASGHKLTDVKRILITHAHYDHIGGLKHLQLLTGAQVITSSGERDVVEGKALMMPLRMTWKDTVMVERVVGEEDTLDDVLGGLVVLETPGHTLAHISFWQPQKRILFCGDVMMNLVGLTLPFAAFTPDMALDRRSVARLAELEPEIVCCGHGALITENAAARLHVFAARVSK